MYSKANKSKPREGRVSLSNDLRKCLILQLIMWHYKQGALEEKLTYLFQSMPLSRLKSTSLQDQDINNVLF